MRRSTRQVAPAARWIGLLLVLPLAGCAAGEGDAEPGRAVSRSVTAAGFTAATFGSSAVSQVVAADLDGDADADVIHVPRAGAVQIYRSQGGALAVAGPSTVPTFTADGGRIAVADLDLDGDLDAVYLRASAAGASRVFLNRWADQGLFRFDVSPALLAGPPLPSLTGVPVLLDWDRDGDPDLVIAGPGAGTWRFLQNRTVEMGHLELWDVTATMATVPPFGAADAAAGDLDHDGFVDLVAVGGTGGLLLHNDGGAHFSDHSAARGVAALAAAHVAVADLDGDGRGDLVAARDGAVALRLDRGAGPLVPAPGGLGAPPSALGALLVVDVTFDGRPDLFFGSGSSAAKHQLWAFDRLGADGLPRYAASAPPAGGMAPAAAARGSSYMDPRRLSAVLAVGAAAAAASLRFEVAAGDGDCDQMADTWEALHGLDPLQPEDADSDADRDEVHARDEYGHGISPTADHSLAGGARDDASLAALLDRDGDRIPDPIDNCDSLVNPDQLDTDGDGLGNRCDLSPAGGASRVPTTSPVTELAFQGGVHGRRYTLGRGGLVDALRRPQALWNQGAGFRLFRARGAGLEALYEIDVVTHHEYRTGAAARSYYEALLADEAAHPGTNAVNGEPREVGWLSPNAPSLGGWSALAPLRNFHHPVEHHQILTIDPVRAAALLAAGYVEESALGYVAPNVGSHDEPAAVYAMREPGGDARHYTAVHSGEPGADDFIDEGMAFVGYLFPRPGLAPLYRVRHPATHDLILTLDAAERASRIAAGYQDQGIVAYVFPSEPAPGSVAQPVAALQRLRQASGRRVYTTERGRFESLLAAGAISEGIEGWAIRPPRAYAQAECTPAPGLEPPTRTAAGKVVARLAAIADPRERGRSAALAFNMMCSLGRVVDGSLPDGPIETELRSHFEHLDPVTRTQLSTAARSLDDIPPAARAELLGSRFARFDPGACTGAPAWRELHDAIFLDGPTLVPRLRTNFCAGNLTYADGTSTERNVTVGSEVIHQEEDVDSGEVVFSHVAATGRPVIIGIDNAVSPAGELTTSPTEGMNPFGVDTGIACPIGDECNAKLGHLCGTAVGLGPHCRAYPVVDQGTEIVVRGFNFWDIEDARFLFQEVANPTQGQFVQIGTSAGMGLLIDAGTSLAPDGGPECSVPGPANPTHDKAHVRVTANFDRFFRLKMFNHNGKYWTHHDAASDDPGEGRVLHICYPADVPFDDIPEDTIRDCVTPTEPCSGSPPDGDGAPCGEPRWLTPPRQLSDCGHDAGQPVHCAETPEWIASEPVTIDPDDVATPTVDPIVFVRKGPPRYSIDVFVDAVECREETGRDWWGSDEARVAVVGFPGQALADPETAGDFIDELVERTHIHRDDDVDTDERERASTLVQSLTGQPEGADIAWLVMLIEEDYDAATVQAVAAVILAAASVAKGAGWISWVSFGVAVLADAAWYAWGGNDMLGLEELQAGPEEMLMRSTAANSMSFLDPGDFPFPGGFSALPLATDGTSEHAPFDDHKLIHSVRDYAVADEPTGPECTAAGPGCSTCFAAMCIDPALDPGLSSTFDMFRERRRYFFPGDFWDPYGWNYFIDLRWELTTEE